MLAGITLRVDEFDATGEIREGVDRKLVQFIESMGFSCILLSNYSSDLLPELSNMNLSLVVLSGGNDVGHYKERDIWEFKLLDFARVRGIPVFGICRGMQMINIFFGGRINRVDGHVRSAHPINFGMNSKQAILVNSFHNFGIYRSGLGNDLMVEAQADDGVIECFRHVSLPWRGISWHPERRPTDSNLDRRLIEELVEWNKGGK